MNEATHRVRGGVIVLSFSLVFSSTSFTSQAPQGQALGVVNASGEVYLGNLPVPGQATIYTGETLRTGADGAAQMAIPGSGTFTLASQSQMSFPGLPSYLAVLEQGTVGMRSFEGAKNLRLRVRNFVVIQDPAHEAAAQVEFSADGNVRVTCVGGSVGVTQFDGPAALFLNPGEVAIITANGILLRGGPQAQTTAEPSTQPPAAGKRKSRTPLYLLLGLGGAAGAAAALATHSSGNRPTTSTTAP